MVGERNWAGNLTYAAGAVLRPGSVDEVCALVAGAERVKALGTRHSFNDVADFAGGVQLDVSGLGSDVRIDDAARTVTVGAATRYGDLARPLHAAGYALANLASLAHCTVAGTVATGTHGSGQRHQGLASAVSGVELVTGDGQVRAFTRAGDPDVFGGLAVSVGALGVLTRVTLDLVPAFDVRQDAFEHLPWDAAFEHFDEIQDAAHSVSMFTDWARDTIDFVLLKTTVEPGSTVARDELFGAGRVDGPRHPAHAAGVSAENCTEQLGVVGPWYDRIPHFRLGFTPSMGDEIQSEYFVPRQDAVAAFEVLRGLGPTLAPLLLVSEIRTVAADELWLSPCHGRDTVALHFTWRPRPGEVAEVLPAIEERLAHFGARPHWGKVFHGSPSADGLYPRLVDFRALATRLDPDGVFRSPFVRRHVFGEL